MLCFVCMHCFQKALPHREAVTILTDPKEVLSAMRYWDRPKITQTELQKTFPAVSENAQTK
jgi:hypothetical protein